MKNDNTSSHIIPNVLDALTKPLDHKLSLGPEGWTLTNIYDDEIVTFISQCEADHIIKAMALARIIEELKRQEEDEAHEVN
jgi:hypothetical protein